MIELLIFYVHIVAVVTMFTKRWQEEGLVEGSLVVVFMGLIFFVGWSITSFVLKLIMAKETIVGFIDRDAASLLMLTVGESVLYYFYLRDEKKGEHGQQEVSQRS